MMKKHYKAIAEIIAESVEFAATTPGHCYNCNERMRNITNELTDYFYSEDSTFDRDEFLRIAGYTVS